MSKEEILDEKHWAFVVGKGISAIHTATFPTAYKEQAMIAMDEYAKQEAIGFAEFLHADEDNHWQMYDGHDTWINIKTRQVKSTTFLYTLYQQSKQAKP